MAGLWTAPAAAQTSTTTTLTISSNPTYWTQSATFTATVLPGATGTVTFYPFDFTAQLVDGQAQYVLMWVPGTYQVTAVYSGDDNYASSTSSAVEWQILPLPTSISMTSPVNGQSGDPGKTVTLSATVSILSPGTTNPTGVVEFLDSGVVIASVSHIVATGDTTGVASVIVTDLASGVHSLTARYDDGSTYLYHYNESCESSPAVVYTVKQTSTTTLAVSTRQAVSTQPVTLTATVTAGATGTVTFYYDSINELGTVTVSGNQAQLTTEIPVGSRVVAATYSGDTVFGASTSATTTVIVGPATSVTTITQPAQGSSWLPGQDVSVTATVAISAPANAVETGPVEFLDNGVVFATVQAMVYNYDKFSQASATLKGLTAGTHILTASIAAETDIAGATVATASTSSPVTITARYTSSVALTPSAQTLEWGQPLTLTAQVASGATGTVTFVDSLNSPSGTTVTVASSQAQLTLSSPRVGTHTITATYAGDGSYGAATSSTLTVIVTPASTVTSLVSPAAGDQLTVGQTVTLSARVQAVTASLVAAGSVEFTDGGTALGTVTLADGAAILSLKNLSSAAHTFGATFVPGSDAQGDTDFAASTSSLVMFDLSKAAVSLALSSSPSAPAYGDEVTFTVSFTATVPAGSSAPSGQVTFQDSGTTLGTATVSQGAATFETQTLGAGTHTITAVYAGDSTWGAATAVASVVVKSAATVATLRSSISEAGEPVLVAQVARQTTGVGVPGGSVQFVDTTDGSVLGAATLDAGSASLAVTAETVMRSYKVVYSGDGNFAASTSAQTIASVNSASYGTTRLAPDGIASVFAVTLLTSDQSATVPLPTALDGVSVTIVDHAGVTQQATIYGVFASSGQINFVVPSGTAVGLGVLTITSSTGASVSGVINVTRVAPAIFTANASGAGVPAATFDLVTPDYQQTMYDAATYDSSQGLWIPLAVDLGSEEDQVYLILYGTGFRNRVDGGVSVSVNGVDAPVQYAGAQSQYPGMDQLNVRLPRALVGAGTVAVKVTVEGQQANSVTIAIR